MTNLPVDRRPKVKPPTRRQLMSAIAESEMLAVGHWESIAAATLSFKQSLLSDGGTFAYLTEQICREQVKVFGRSLDRIVFGQASRRYGKRVRRIPVLEKGIVKGWHCHILIEFPAVEVRAAKLRRQVLETWQTLSWAGSDNQVDLNVDWGFLGYGLKVRSKEVFEVPTDSIIFEALVNPGPK